MALIVAFEGLPGSGKTTIIGMLAEELRKRGFKIGIADMDTIGDAPVLRSIAKNYPFDHPVRILLFWVLHLQQYQAIFEFVSSDIVIVDRFWGSAIAYDVYGSGIPRGLLEWVGDFIRIRPHLTFFLKLSLDEAEKRKKSETMENKAFARRVAQGYNELVEAFNWIKIDASQEPELVKNCCLKLIIPELKK